MKSGTLLILALLEHDVVGDLDLGDEDSNTKTRGELPGKGRNPVHSLVRELEGTVVSICVILRTIVPILPSSILVVDAHLEVPLKRFPWRHKLVVGLVLQLFGV